MYLFSGPIELCNRQDEPQELHNIARLPECVDLRRHLAASVLRWLVESNDFVPGQKDTKYPAENLEGPRPNEGVLTPLRQLLK